MHCRPHRGQAAMEHSRPRKGNAMDHMPHADWKEKVEKTELPNTFQNVKYNNFQSFLESLQNQSSLSNSWISENLNRFMKWLTI